MARAAPTGPSITFDSDGQIRLLDPKVVKHTKELEDECREFLENVSRFSEEVTSIMEVLQKQADAIDKIRSRAVGTRNLREIERDGRGRREAQVKALIAEKKAELERLTVEVESLERVERDQKELIERLTNPET